MEPNARIEAMIAPTLEALGFELVRVRLQGGDHPVLQIMAEPLSGEEMTVEHCADISRAASALLDVEDPISGAYDLEVSSPGLDRPLVKPADFERFTGQVAKLESKRLLDGRKRFRGTIKGVEENVVRLELESGQTASVPFQEIADAKLVITDEVIAEALRSRDKSADSNNEDVGENA